MKVVKANRALLKKRNTFKEVGKMHLKANNKTQVHFKEVSPERLARIKMEIRKKAKSDAWKNAGIYALLLTGMALGLYWLIYV